MTCPVYDYKSFQSHVLDKLKREQETKSATQSPPSSTWRILEHISLITSQAKLLLSNFLSHHVTGPRKPSWPIQLTLIISVMRNLFNHAHLVNIQQFRQLLDFHNPLIPSDIIVTPVSFRVRPYGLEGVLTQLDGEDRKSRREIAGEWIVTKELWRKINQQYYSACHKHYMVDNEGTRWSNEQVILFLHGGGYYSMSARTYRDLTCRLSQATERRVFAINYRLAPEYPFPYGLHDAVHAFLYLTDPCGLAIQPQNIVVAGDGAGGGLALALLQYLRDHHMPLPGGAMLFSPWVDLTMSCESWDRNQSYDVLIKPNDDDLFHPVRLYLNPYEKRKSLITHPYVSPLFGDLGNLPPILIQYGDAEVLHDEISLLANKIVQTRTTFVQYEVYDDMVHVFQAFDFLDSAKKALESAGDFVRNTIPLQRRRNPSYQLPFHRKFAFPVFDLDTFEVTSAIPEPSIISSCTPTELLEPTTLSKLDKATSTEEDDIVNWVSRICAGQTFSDGESSTGSSNESGHTKIDDDDETFDDEQPYARLWRSMSQPEFRQVGSALRTSYIGIRAVCGRVY
ncbi:4349_t:CDS:2 [Paraglomus occultum]|uniref:4349_t:CDS:1 n=1 Tax=Paraglomus occultum TaxID=144539 RepID=A0A9N8Z5E9_9GLOM|nr:4349_t:CDS:2 [Paraglomus occultum]